MQQALGRGASGSSARIYPLVIGGRAVETDDDDRVAQSVARSGRSSARVAGGRRRARRAGRRGGAAALARLGAALGAEQRAEFLRRGRRSHARAALRAGRLGSLRVRQGAGARPTPTSPRRSTSASTTPPARSQLEAPHGVDVPGEENRFEYLPRGVAAVIAPWNFPLAILTGMTTAALATGNTVVMKPAEQSAGDRREADGDLSTRSDLPPGVLNFLPGRGEVVGAALVEHPDVAVDRLHRLAARRPGDQSPRGRSLGQRARAASSA